MTARFASGEPLAARRRCAGNKPGHRMCKDVQKRQGALQAEGYPQVQDLFVCEFSFMGYNGKAMLVNSCITTEVNTCLQQMIKTKDPALDSHHARAIRSLEKV